MSGFRNRDEFFGNTSDLQKVQGSLLLETLIASNAESAYGRAHNFASIQSIEEYRQSVPLVQYEDIRPWVDRVAAGESGVLTKERVIAFFKTSGSLSKPKLIPVTTTLMRQKVATFATYWEQIYDLYPGVRDGMMVSNFSDASDTERTHAGIEVYSESGFWARRGRSLHSLQRWPLPAAIRLVKDSDARLYATARLLLQADLHCIMCLNPSTLLQFLRTIEQHADSLIAGLGSGGWGTDNQTLRSFLDDDSVQELSDRLVADTAAAARLSAAVADGNTPPMASLWPQLDIVICWCSVVVQPYFKLLKPYLGSLPVRDYITQSSECMMAIPIADHQSGGALAYSTHFFEFIAEQDTAQQQPQTYLAWQLEVGKRYEVVVTTGGGLYRYRMGDCIQVTGDVGGVPTFEFLYRLGKTSSMTGEKLTEFQILDAAAKASSQTGFTPEEFVCYPCTGEVPHYAVMVDVGAQSIQATVIAEWAGQFEQALNEANSEYADKCASGRLGGLRAFRVAGGALRAARHARKADGVSDEQIKAEVLTSTCDLHQLHTAVESVL